jgi:predicted DsbA family dithiol-disulfide isomerase
MSDQRVIEVFADVGCPFTHVGLRRFIARRAELGRPDVLVRVLAWPLELVNGAPLDAGFIAEEVEELREQVVPDLFAGFDRSTFPSTSLPALALAAAADAADVRTGERVSLALRDLVFEQGIDVSDEDVVRSVAEAHGVPTSTIDSRRVTDQYDEGVRRGVIGSPHFFTPAGDFFCPALEIHRDDDGRLLIEPRIESFERFLAGCFA